MWLVQQEIHRLERRRSQPAGCEAPEPLSSCNVCPTSMLYCCYACCLGSVCVRCYTHGLMSFPISSQQNRWPPAHNSTAYTPLVIMVHNAHRHLGCINYDLTVTMCSNCNGLADRPLMWCNSVKYLSVHLVSGKNFKTDLTSAKRKYYGCSNSI